MRSKKYRPKIKFPILRVLIVMYVLFLLLTLTIYEAGSSAFLITGLLGVVSLYNFLKPKWILMIVSLVYFLLAEIIILASIFIATSENIVYFFYGWAIINVLPIVYTLILFKSLGPTYKKK